MPEYTDSLPGSAITGPEEGARQPFVIAIPADRLLTLLRDYAALEGQTIPLAGSISRVLLEIYANKPTVAFVIERPTS